MRKMITSLPAVAALCAPLAAVLVTPVQAADRTCQLDDEKKVCASLHPTPAEEVQPSNLPDPNNPGSTLGPTYIVYRVEIDQLDKPQTARVLEVDISVPAGAPVQELIGDGGSQGLDLSDCTFNATSVSCDFDKFDALSPESFGVRVQAPEQEGAFTVDMEFGWNMLKTSLSSTVQVSRTAGESYVPPNTAVTLVTAPQTADPRDQTSAENPLWAKLYVPAQEEHILASIEVIDGVDPNRNDACVEGVFLSVEDGGPYLCRDLGNGNRWVAIGLSDNFSNGNLEVDMIWHTSIVPDEQQSPNALAPTGLPPFAVLYHPDANTPDQPIRAFGDTCGPLGSPPCLNSVEEFDDGDWMASFATPYVLPSALLPSVGEVVDDKAATLSGLREMELFEQWLEQQRARLRGELTSVDSKEAFNPPPPKSLLPLFN